MSKLALGTVQLGQAYGIANRSGKPSFEIATQIVRIARAAGIDTLDTAVAYGDSEALLGRIGVEGWRIVTKVPPLPPSTGPVANWLSGQVRESLQRLQVSRVDALLLHRPADVLGGQGREYLEALRGIRAQGLCGGIGVSIYDPGELDALWPSWQPDVVQAPFNVLDRRLLRSGWLSRLQENGVRIHTRSAFLQGLLLMRPEDRPEKFDRWRPLLDRWSDWCREHGADPLSVALGVALREPGIERVVVGADSVTHLEQIVAAAAADVPLPATDMACDDRDLLEPSRWAAR